MRSRNIEAKENAAETATNYKYATQMRCVDRVESVKLTFPTGVGERMRMALWFWGASEGPWNIRW